MYGEKKYFQKRFAESKFVRTFAPEFEPQSLEIRSIISALAF